MSIITKTLFWNSKRAFLVCLRRTPLTTHYLLLSSSYIQREKLSFDLLRTVYCYIQREKPQLLQLMHPSAIWSAAPQSGHSGIMPKSAIARL